MKIIWSPLAVQRVIENAEYIAQDKPGAAANWADGAFAAVERLAEYPLSGRTVPETGREDLREIAYGAYRIVYRVLPGAVRILTVRHGRRRLDLGEIRDPAP